MKQQLSSILKANRIYFLSCLSFLAICSVILFYNNTITRPSSTTVLHSFGLNVFFVNYTFFGDGIFSLLLCIFLYTKNQKKLALYLLMAYLSSGLTIQLLKQMIDGPGMRIYFEASQYLFHYFDQGNGSANGNHFPSGHTASAFVLATILCIYFRKHSWSMLFLFAAILVGYSRIFLAGHSPADVLTGAFIGTAAATLSVVLVNSNSSIHLPKKMKRLLQAGHDNFPGTAVS